MVWYERLDRTVPYPKNYQGFNLWYNFNNGKHQDMKRVRTWWIDHWIRRMTKHECFNQIFWPMVILPFIAYAFKIRKRFKTLPEQEETVFSGSQFVAFIGRNHWGYETRASKSFESAINTLMGKDIISHITNQDNDPYRVEELEDEKSGLVGDFTEEDIIELRKQEKHEPHLGIVFRYPEHHYLNEKPNDMLSPYKLQNEKI